ncbi:L-leucine ABC transporter membrane protein /L-isoleucine ABC transporter membrane protein /L-valine ABC transporter membrane protein [Plasticicumulans lactativorans]|uniref:L-leucine ABC transporter membrane protein /L-isoleucine ABC transporter membrane protein /L-valine ABC transporter membrane protein n=1 Tax=Plasticicumulans lactativorans TaxID=1133106 RepID=A0A4R2LN73_9GAMM|nr:high-affinity branched-chain amino acid ABC transporter permease LivH [Plasticicumulans lactativorans]TCO80905.1 L-leucine ABC transporter membrane protein /L-isoleucine ABC transporter membrane protein /L-valine ABC transporter membrane protein [Plasticicumulans lactativorans]
MNEFLPQFLQQLINGLSLGSIYALIAIGYTMVYGIIGMINFAHGEVFMIGAYVGLVTLTAIGAAAGLPVWLLVVIAVLVSVLVTSAYGWAIERVAYRPLRGSPRLVPLISAIGMSIFLQNYVHLAQGSRDMPMPDLITGYLFQHEFANGFTVSMSNSRALIIFVAIALMVALTLYIGRSRMGRACRACSQDMGMANLLGIDTNRVISFTFVLGAALAAVGGVLIGLSVGKINPFIGFVVGVKAFTAAVLGGIGSIPGAMLGGALLGITETFASAYLPTEYKDVVAFSLLVLILLFRPTGLLGRPDVEKV